MTVKTNTAPELTHEQVVRVLTQPLEAASLFLANGPTIYDTSSPLRVPKLGGPIADPGWTGEAESIPERDVTFGEVQLMPTTMKSVKVISRFSNELARQSIVALDAVIQQRVVKDVADKIDAQFWGASGDGVTTPKASWPSRARRNCRSAGC